MQEGIIQIGKVLMKDKNLLDNLVTQVSSMKGKKQQHLLKLDFATDHVELKIDGLKEIDEKTAKEYLYIGGAGGANAPQWYSTTNNKYYHLSETIPNLMTKELGDELLMKIQFIMAHYFVEIDSSFKSNKNRYALNLDLLMEGGCGLHEYYAELEGKQEKEKKEEIKKEILNRFELYIKDKCGLSYADIGLYTILIDGKPLCGYMEYQNAIVDDKKKVSGKAKIQYGVCSACNGTKELRSDINVEIKTYTTNLQGFAHNVDKNNYAHNMQLCPECLQAYLAGEKYIKNNLDLRLARFRVYAYPHFILAETMNKAKLKRFASYTKDSFQTINAVGTLMELNQYLENYQEQTQDTSMEVDTCSLDIVFYRNVQKGTKIQSYIKNVAPVRLRKIAEAIRQVSREFNVLLGREQEKTWLNLRMIYYLIPMREKDGDVTQYRNFLQLYTAILSKEFIDLEYIIKNLNRCARVLHFQEAGYNVSLGENASAEEYEQSFVRKMLQGDALIWFLREIENLKGVKEMDYESLELDQELKNYIEKMKYGEMETSLFLLGSLMGRIGTAQYKRNPEKKPILNKLNFSGMDKGKLIRLGNIIFEKLSQEKLLGSNEKIYATAMGLLDENIAEWKLSKNENLHYLLSGFSYMTKKAMNGKKEQGGKENE